MTQHSLTTRLDHYINTMLPETHGHQRKAFRDFVAALLVTRSCCQAALARGFANFEAASRRLTRWLHNPRLDPQSQARAHAQAIVAQLPRTGPIRVAIDWTTEDQQHLVGGLADCGAPGRTAVLGSLYNCGVEGMPTRVGVCLSG